MCHVADASDLEAIMPWLRESYPNWIAEVTRGVELGTCIVHDDLGFACYDVNRAGWFGPMATRAPTAESVMSAFSCRAMSCSAEWKHAA